jgi:hypothetical protein
VTFCAQKLKLASTLSFFILVILICGCHVRPLMYFCDIGMVGDDGTVSGIDYGYDAKGALQFVVFKIGNSNIEGVYHAEWRSSGTNSICVVGTIKLPNGEVRDLLSSSDKQMYEAENGAVSLFPINFSKLELDKYIGQEKTRYSAKNLRKFLNK